MPPSTLRVPVPWAESEVDLDVSKLPTARQKDASLPDTPLQSGFTHSSNEPVSIWTNCGCGGGPRLTGRSV